MSQSSTDSSLKKNEAACSLSILVGCPDLPFAETTIRHIVRSHSHPFVSKILVVDNCRDHADTPARDALESLDMLAKSLRQEGVFNRVVRLDAFHQKERETLTRHFGTPPPCSRDFRGVPLAGWVAGISACPQANYHAHFDSDILIHSQKTDWIAQGIDYLQRHDDTLTVAPHPGPPGPAGSIQQPEAYRKSQDAYVFPTFSSRRFLVNKSRLDRILPLGLRPASRRHTLRRWLLGRSDTSNWEMLMSEALRRCGMWRAQLRNPATWTLHAADHGEDFLRILPRLVQDVEAGNAPPDQLGHYDVILPAWLGI